jgi:hypothetical protein
MVLTLTVASFVGALTPAPNTVANPSGIFIKDASGKLTRIPNVETDDVQTSGAVKSALSQGFAKPNMTARYRGASATFVVTDPQPTFVFRFMDMSFHGVPKPDPSRSTATPSDDDDDVAPLMGKAPKEYALGKLVVEGDARLASSKNIETIKFDATPTGAPREFEVRVAAPLQPGEYGFFMVGNVPAQIWAFSMKPKTP